MNRKYIFIIENKAYFICCMNIIIKMFSQVSSTIPVAAGNTRISKLARDVRPSRQLRSLHHCARIGINFRERLYCFHGISERNSIVLVTFTL